MSSTTTTATEATQHAKDAEAGAELVSPAPQALAGAQAPGKRHFIVSGRVSGDDEDSVFAFEADGHKDAVDEFKALLRDSGPSMSDEEWALLESNGQIFVNSVYHSVSPIEVSAP